MAERIWRGQLETVERASNIRALIEQDLTTDAVVVILGPEAEAEATEGVIFTGTWPKLPAYGSKGISSVYDET